MKNFKNENQMPVDGQNPLQNQPQASSAAPQGQIPNAAPATQPAPKAAPEAQPASAPKTAPNPSAVPNGMPKSGYPQSGMPVSGYPASGYGISALVDTPKKENNGLKAMIVILVIILIGILALILVCACDKDSGNHGTNNPSPPPTNQYGPPPPGPPPVQYEPGTIVIDGQDCNGAVDYYRNEEIGMTFFDMKQFFEFVGADVVISGDVVTIATNTQIAVFTVGSDQVEITMKQTGNMRTGFIHQAPYREGDKIYFYIRDLITVFNTASVNYDDNTDVTYIYFSMMPPPGGQMGAPMGPPPPGPGPGGPGGPPPGGPAYGGGYSPAPAPAPQGQPAAGFEPKDIEVQQPPQEESPQGQSPQGQPPQGQPPQGQPPR